MQDANVVAWIGEKYQSLCAAMNERLRRQWAAVEALSLGFGGIAAVSRATGLSRTTIHVGMREVRQLERNPQAPVSERIRRPGGGRKRAETRAPRLGAALARLLEPATRGDPQSPLRWTCKSTRRLAEELTRLGYAVSARTVARLLKADGYSLQANRKTREGTDHPDRNAQFEYINAQVRRFQRGGQPVISVDTKKKELIGDFKAVGREWQAKGKPLEVRTHDFMDKDLGKAIPYGVYDVTNNEGWVSVGIDHDTARFAARAIGRWWITMGQYRYPNAKRLLITADGGGSNASRSRLWKVALQELADDLGLTLQVCHFPPGTSKWNKIEHRMFCHITQNWRGKPLVSHEVVVNLIAKTTTQKGLTVNAELDTAKYPTKETISPEQYSKVQLRKHAFHGDWNYSLLSKFK